MHINLPALFTHNRMWNNYMFLAKSSINQRWALPLVGPLFRYSASSGTAKKERNSGFTKEAD